MITPLEAHYAIPKLDLDCLAIEEIPADLIQPALMHKTRIVPLRQCNNTLYVLSDGNNLYSTLKEIQFHTGLAIQPVLVEANKLDDFINKLVAKNEQRNLANYFTNTIKTIPSPNIPLNQDEQDDAPITKFVQHMLQSAVQKQASDIHIEPFENELRIRYRLDGLLHPVTTLPTSLAPRITARIKIMANLDIAEKRIPQDGRFNIKNTATEVIDCRVNTCPTVYGEKTVIRLLNPGALLFNIDKLGFTPDTHALFINAIQQPQGMIVVTGPTGCGKTSTLYAALQHVNTVDKNIATVEDPVELRLAGINQVHIQPKCGLTFTSALRALLRQDPDIMMIGEMRDLETAEIAIKAAQTGHLVFSTLHTSSAAETITRLINMGIQGFNLVGSLSLIIAQRLVRKRCQHCTTATTIHTKGCNQCVNGYNGRIALFEVMPITAGIQALILSNSPAVEIEKLAQQQGMLTLYQDGLDKVQQDITTMEELKRVITC